MAYKYNEYFKDILEDLKKLQHPESGSYMDIKPKLNNEIIIDRLIKLCNSLFAFIDGILATDNFGIHKLQY